LARNPEAQRKLRSELKNSEALDYDSINKLAYLDAVAREGLVSFLEYSEFNN